MSEIGMHKPWFQLTQARVAELSELSRTVCDKAIQQLVMAGYMARVECRKAGRRFGHVLQSCLAGKIVKLDGYVTHFPFDVDTKEAATRQARKKAGNFALNPDQPQTARNLRSER